MKPVYSHLKPKLQGLAATLTILLLASCGTYNNATQMEDGIYSSESSVETPNEAEEAVSENKNNYYQQYFKTKAQNLEEIPEEDVVFTDIDAYSTYESMDEEGYIIEQDYDERYGAWGENDTDVTINVYNNGWGNYNYWNYGYYNYWGYNNYYFRPGWATVGFGWGGWGSWYGGYGGYYGFNPYWGYGAGYYGNPYCYNNPYNNGGYYGNSYAYQGRRSVDRGRSNYDYSTRRNTRSSYDRNSLTGRRDNNVTRRSTSSRNSTYSRNSSTRPTTTRPSSSRTRPTTTRPSNTRTRPSTTRPSNTRTKSSSSRTKTQTSRPSSSSRSSTIRSSSSSSRSSGSTRSSSSRSSSRRGGK